MTTDYIPFVNTVKDGEIAKALYADAVAFRLSLESIEKVSSHLPSGPAMPKIWLDPSVDGLHHKDLSNLTDSYQAHIEQMDDYEKIADPDFQNKPDKEIVYNFVFSVLNRCMTYQPDWLSIPQLPIAEDTSRNKINKLLAEGTRRWKQQNGFIGKLILPAIFTNQRELNKKTERNKKISVLLNCFNAAAADGVWAVDSSLSDQQGSKTFDERFPALRNLHEEINSKLPEGTITIGGPYWGMNLILWARGLVRYTGIGLGNSYKYNVPGLKVQQRKMKTRIALPPLRRWATTSMTLKQWLADAASKLPSSDAAEFVSLEKDLFKWMQASESARKQVATFYKYWFHKFSSLPPSGRALALYQDLSTAYVLGTTLHSLPLPEDEAPGRNPARVAQQFMMNCL